MNTDKKQLLAKLLSGEITPQQLQAAIEGRKFFALKREDGKFNVRLFPEGEEKVMTTEELETLASRLEVPGQINGFVIQIVGDCPPITEESQLPEDI